MTTPTDHTPDENDVMRAFEERMRLLGCEPRNEDYFYVATLPPAQLDQLLVRLDALVRLKDGASMKDASKVAGVSVPTMYRLSGTWKDAEKRSLQALAGFSSRKPRGAGKSEELEAARTIARLLVKEPKYDHLSLNGFASLIRQAVFDAISLSGAERIAREVRREWRLEPRNLGSYGRAIAVDVSAISLVIDEPSRQVPPSEARRYIAIMSLVMETTSGLILGWRVGPEEESVKGQSDALVSAWDFIEAERADVPRDQVSELKVAVGPSTDPWHEVLLKQLSSARYLTIRAHGHRRFGQWISRIIGPAIGRIQFLPNSTQGGDPAAAAIRTIGQVPVSHARACAIVGRIVDDHNSRLLGALRSSAVLPDPADEFSTGVLQGALQFTRPPAARSTKTTS